MLEGWRTVELAYIAKLSMGETLLSKSLTGDGLPVFSANTDDGPWGFTSNNRRRLRRGDIVIGARGSIGFPRRPNFDAFTCTQTTIAVEPDRDVVDSEYLHYALCAKDILGIASQQAVPMLTIGSLSPLEVALPPLDEQRRIAEVLRSVDEAIALAQAIADQAQTVWHGLTERLMWDRQKQNADLARPLGNALESSDYGVNASLGNEPVGHAILRMGNLQDGYIDATDVKWAEIAEADAEVLALDVGDILFNRTNSRDLVGKVALVREPTDFLYASYIVRLRVNRSVADPYYLFAVMHSGRAQSQFKSIATPGVSQSNINPTNLKKQVIPLPPLAEQQGIAAQLQSVENVRRTAVNELVTLRQIKSDLMSDLLSGRVRVPA
ncbi:restriction endonuclease subunit S [Sphingosinithalassobacter sp. LHW66-3]|uniref:restriction endonuclease subunit S n=1 Tax=Sphingosinithalassobacter sp. LHW66-3 TaxID=3424718 RepID=UPI003D6A83EF